MITLLIAGVTLGFITNLLRFFTQVLPSAETLPWGIDGALTSFTQIIASLIYYAPWLEVIWHIFLLALIVKLVLFTIQFSYFVLKLIRG